MKKFTSIFLTAFSALLLASCAPAEPTPITWNSGTYDVQSNFKPKPSVYEFSSLSTATIFVNNQEINGAVCDICFDFKNNTLISAECTYKEHNSDDQKATYETVKAAVSSTFGEPSVSDKIRKNETDHTEYKCTEWSDDVTTVQLSYNLRYTDEYNVELIYSSIKALEAEEQKRQQETQTVTSVDDNGYLNYVKWTLQTPYTFAIEKSDFDGDVWCAGKYTFVTSNTSLGEAPIYDVYIKDREYAKISELGSADFSVGGAKASPIEYTLKPGDYVYIVPYTKLVYTPKGYLEIKQ